ncbi:hypothetical protein C8035_v011289 [Colletotrichum spinosum]|uniref:Uncharacterized protein n=1 Tax=Colletotrichum spinosum TaxID=1347390 RepID=A0A4R8PY74_9PEZI|nr:hypothetical protein C8035_v011289 [Colletotrichum spinosum]
MPVEAAEHAAERSPLPPRRRQDIEETLFIEARIGPEAARASDFESISADNFTVKCAARTTRAFFELPNLHTDLRPSAPIDEWPLDEDMEAKFHDYDWDGNLITRDWKEGWNRDVYSGWTSSQGPLRSTVEALFGNESYPRVMLDFLGETFPDGNIPDNFNTSDEASRASQRKGCAIDPPLRAWQLPYNSRNDKFDDWYPSIYNGCTLKKLPKSLFRMAQGLQHSAVSTLGVGMYLANVGVLQDAASSDAARMIYNLTGADFVAPRYNFGAVFTLSVLLGLQVLLLALLTYYIYSLPTWTDTLDGIAMMRIGTQLRDSALLTSLRRVDEDDMVRLGEIDGLVGVVPRPGSTPEDDLELAAMATTLRQSMGASHQYEIVRPASPASTVPSVDLPAVPQQTRQPAQSTLPGMSASDFSSYLQEV